MNVSKPDYTPSGLLARATQNMAVGDYVAASTAALVAIAAVAVADWEAAHVRPAPYCSRCGSPQPRGHLCGRQDDT